MSQFNAPTTRRSGGDIDVYTGLLLVATIVLAVGVFVLATGNIDHSDTGSGNGGAFTLIS